MRYDIFYDPEKLFLLKIDGKIATYFGGVSKINLSYIGYHKGTWWWHWFHGVFEVDKEDNINYALYRRLYVR